MSKEHEETVESVSRELFRMGRMLARQSLTTKLRFQPDVANDLSHVLVVQAVEELHRDSGQSVSVGEVARWLGVEASTASRLVANASRAGLLSRSSSPGDARRAELELSLSGQELYRFAREYQRDVFQSATRNWSDAERSEFSRLFVRFASELGEMLESAERAG